MATCLILVAIYVLTELLGAMDGWIGTTAEQIMITITPPSNVQNVIDKVYLVSALSQIAPC